MVQSISERRSALGDLVPSERLAGDELLSHAAAARRREADAVR
jgi:hypothetical protein